jgi:hypothetical protein
MIGDDRSFVRCMEELSVIEEGALAFRLWGCDTTGDCESVKEKEQEFTVRGAFSFKAKENQKHIYIGKQWRRGWVVVEPVCPLT